MDHHVHTAVGAPVSLRLRCSARSFFSRHPFTGSKIAVVLLLAGASVLSYAQDIKSATTHPKARVHVMRPASGLREASELHAPFAQRAMPRPNLKAVNTGSGIVFTCASNVATATCNYLNTTVAGWYNSTFTNANAAIYIMYGSTGLAESTTGFYNFATYDDYVAALNGNSAKSAIQTSSLSALDTYDGSHYGSDYVEVTSALGTTLGFPDMLATTLKGDTCTPGAAGCYNGIITVTNDKGTPLYYDNLGGAEPKDAYDFYGVVAHETDEVLGTSSCVDTQNSKGLVDDCDGAAPSGGPGTPSAVDLFRYSSKGELALDADLSTAPGAYFSYDGGSTDGAKSAAGGDKVYNTLDNGDDYADFVSSSPDCGTDIVVQDAEGCPGEDKGLSILNDGGGEINILNAVGYNIPVTTSKPPKATLTEDVLAFGSEKVGKSTASKVVTLKNNGGSVLDITSITLEGTNTSSFKSTNTCGSTLAVGAECKFTQYFKPTKKGKLTANVNIVDNASNSPQKIWLTGTGD